MFIHILLVALNIFMILITYLTLYTIKNQVQSLDVSKLLLETSQLLTNNIRNYIITGDKKYLKKALIE